MSIYPRLSWIVPVLFLSAVGTCTWLLDLPAAQAAGPETVDTALLKPAPLLRPIERAFEKIRIGMPDEDMLALMTPFEKADEPPAPWGRYAFTWTDGQISICVVLGNSGTPFLEEHPPVGEKYMYKKVFAGGEKKWLLMSQQPQE